MTDDNVRFFKIIPVCIECGTTVEYSVELAGPICYECFVNLPTPKDATKEQGEWTK